MIDVPYLYIGDRKAIVSLKNGTRLVVPTHDPFIGCQIALRRESNMLLERTITERVTTSSRCINVGANIGYYSILFASLCNAIGEVFCFEPNPKNVELMVFSFHLNGFDNCAHIYQSAVSNVRGSASFLMPRNYSDGWIVPDDYEKYAARPQFEETGRFVWEGQAYRDAEVHKVPVVTLDHVLGNAGPFDFLLCDAEGFDFNVILGAKHVIKNSPALTIVFEWNASFFDQHFGRNALDDVFSFLISQGYRTSYCKDGAWTPFAFGKVGIPSQECDILCEPG